MGLAPYGDSDLYFRFVSILYKFNPDGSYDLNIARLGDLAYDLGIVGRAEPPTRKWERKIHFAAAVQQLLEVVVIDILSWWQAKLDLKNLCLAGEVAQNCVLNGAIANSKKFENIFVHPASHDAGAALGAAIYIGKQRPSSLYNVMNGVIANAKKFENVFVHSASHDAGAPLGSEIYIGKQRTPAHDAPAVSFSPLLGPKLPQNDDIRREIKTWEGGLRIVECDDVFEAAAEKLAEGKIVGWARGRSEFGPSALGNRSILGDPRPRQNWQGINLAIKQRESFRPFGSAVLAEDFNDYFNPLPSNPNMEHMVFVTKVREEKRAELGAVTHVNGTGCVQVVTKSANPDFWKLISAFKERTGCPVLLNTSFNNQYEPIVQNVTDAVRTFLTTGLDYLFIENTMAEKSSEVRSLIATASLRLSDVAWVEEITTVRQRRTVLRRAPSYTRELNNWQLARYLCESGSEFSLVAHLVDGVSPKDRDQLIEEIFLLWQERFIDVRPTKVARLGGPIGADLSF
ncbi:hypothetical protein ATY31_11295 [Sinorhizobium americanum]|uniref:Carbamoyltransferase n=2 Tax=Sinorhizobium/Ensifer group TaxID=227292 RepID=A0A2S3YQ94_9HYPH|nr:hypothetical protein ATY31_11295 [Sinorhizobium americanum]